MPQRAEKIEQIRQFPSHLEAAVSTLTATELDLPCAEGEWTPRQVVHHIADSHLNGFIRMKLALAEDYPTLKPYNQDDWIKLADIALPLEPSLDILRGVHARWSILLESVSEEGWSRTAFHPENGVMSIDDLLNLYVSHGVDHLAQITKLKKPD